MVLRALSALVEGGAIVAGPKPTDDPSLADDQAEFARLSDRLFGNGTGAHSVGSGTVFAGESPSEVFKELGVLLRTFDYSRPNGEGPILSVHRRIADGDIYFLDNRSAHEADVDATFRVTGKAPELWRAESGTARTPRPTRSPAGERQCPCASRHGERCSSCSAKIRTPPHFRSRKRLETPLATIAGPWAVAFQEGRGAPPSLTLDGLESWSDNANPGVKFFSGTGTYTKTIDAPPEWLAGGAHVWIDLGDVKNLAVVELNGVSLGTVWHAPFRVDLTGALREGANQLTVKVTNAWVNRLIGDEQPGAEKYTFADFRPYKANSPLQASGLLGPVRVISVSASR